MFCIVKYSSHYAIRIYPDQASRTWSGETSKLCVSQADNEIVELPALAQVAHDLARGSEYETGTKCDLSALL